MKLLFKPIKFVFCVFLIIIGLLIVGICFSIIYVIDFGIRKFKILKKRWNKKNDK